MDRRDVTHIAASYGEYRILNKKISFTEITKKTFLNVDKTSSPASRGKKNLAVYRHGLQHVQFVVLKHANYSQYTTFTNSDVRPWPWP